MPTRLPVTVEINPAGALPDHRRRWLMLGLALVAQVTVAMITQGVPTLAPFIQEDLGLSRGEVGLVGSAIMMGTLSALAVAGWAVDAYGERVVLIGGNLAVGLFSLAVLGASGLGTVLAVLYAAGIGAAVSTPAGSKTVMVWFPAALRGTAMGIRQTGVPLGGALAAAMLPALAFLAGWRAAVAVAAAAALVAGLACWALYEHRDGHWRRGSALSGFRGGWRSILSRDVLLLSIGGMLLPLGQFCLVTYLAIYLKETYGVPVVTSAALLVGAQIAGVAGRVLWGAGSDRVFGRRRRPALLGATGLASLGALALGWFPVGAPTWLLAVLVPLFGFNAIGWQGSWVSLLSELSGPERQGRTIGLAMTILYVGIIVGPPAFGFLVDQTRDWRLAWSVLAVLLAAGAATVLPVRETGLAHPTRQSHG
ncbi:MAG: MFS transporter [Chloroflexi bacterium]|nr:MFS transporter [Chloroflexota bacterium]